jgi:2-iminobutanoate/2-iminopropanoate deaminase
MKGVDIRAARSAHPFSEFRRYGQFLFTAGQIGDDANPDIRTQTRQALEKMKALLESAGTTMDNVLKTTVYLANMDDYESMNEVYKEFFKALPARVVIQVPRVGARRGSKIKIDAIAFAL